MEDKPLRVLLVEDSRAEADLVRDMLANVRGVVFDVTWVDRLADALDLLQAPAPGDSRGPKLPFDVALLDCNLPDSSGLSTFEIAHRAEPRLPILILTNLEDEETALSAVGMGAQDYLLKREVDDRLLTRAIRYAIERERSERARRVAEAQLLHEAMHDSLTGLPNRTLFLDRLGVSLARSRRWGESPFAVLFLDLDRFKTINDSLGHAAGDDVLKIIAGRLQESLRPGDTVARLGGDEFVLLLEDVESPPAATQVARRVQDLVARPFRLAEHDVFTSASIGIALSTAGYQRPEEILRDADIAMYRAKAAGRARYEVFDRDMHQTAVALLQLETDLRRAVQHEEFLIHYQPIVSLDTGGIVGFEALVRWDHPERGLVAPKGFIAVAEETGLMVPLGWWVLREACGQVAAWNARSSAWGRAADAPLTVSCNVSGKLIAQHDVVDRTVAILEDARLDPSLLRLEITENVLLDHGEAVLDRLTELRALGVQLHVDDFGTGYSSLSYLQRFRYDTLKIDRSFVRALGSRVPGDNGGKIVQTIVALGNQLRMNVIAEGVETADQARQLRLLRCPQGQGFWFARPMEPGQAEAMLARRPTWPGTA